MLIDVRSPAEYAHAHIPDALNLPLFSNEERHQVGLCYKLEGKDVAFQLGLQLVGPKLASFVSVAKDFESIEIYCWRGGMRSQSMGWLFQQAGIPTQIRKGGYKAYRREVLEILKRPYKLKILSGLTGAGKTEVLRKKTQYIDLEDLANHRGSAFGARGPQPSNEQLENLLTSKLLKLNAEKTTWVEDESRVVGSCKVPDDFFHQMMEAEREEVKCSFDERVERLVTTYGSCEPSMLEEAINQLERRLGTERTKKALSLLKESDLEPLVTLLLEYYDKAYEKSQKRYNRYHEHTL